MIKIPGLTEKQVKIFAKVLEAEIGEDAEFIMEDGDWDDITEIFQECACSKEKVDSDYIHQEYKFKDKGHKFTLTYSSYRKDGGICDGEWDDEVYYKAPKKKAKKINTKDFYEKGGYKYEILGYDEGGAVVNNEVVIKMLDDYAKLIKK
jgi:hypothetical protein